MSVILSVDRTTIRVNRRCTRHNMNMVMTVNRRITPHSKKYHKYTIKRTTKCDIVPQKCDIVPQNVILYHKTECFTKNVIFFHIVWYFSEIILPQIVVFNYKI